MSPGVFAISHASARRLFANGYQLLLLTSLALGMWRYAQLTSAQHTYNSTQHMQGPQQQGSWMSAPGVTKRLANPFVAPGGPAFVTEAAVSSKSRCVVLLHPTATAAVAWLVAHLERMQNINPHADEAVISLPSLSHVVAGSLSSKNKRPVR